jgi:acetyl-CoA C-acetyltransferase
MEKMTRRIIIASAVRTPIGKFLGSLSILKSPHLGSYAIKESIRRAGINPRKINEVIMGNVLQAGSGQNPARQASILSGVPETVGAFTINKVCGSGLKAVILAAQSIKARENKIVVAGGMESMSNAPHILRDGRKIVKYGDIKKSQINDDAILEDSMIKDSLWCAFNTCHMGVLAEKLAKKYEISRKEQDEFSLKSHRKSIASIDSGSFKKEIVPINVESRTIDTDECPRRDTNLERLGELKAVFKKNGSITAGNASQLSDGAAALLVTTDKTAEKYDIEPMAEIEYYTSSAVKPKWYTTAPVLGIKSLLKKTKHDINDFDAIELNEAYSVQALAVAREIGIDESKLNISGGSIALGHPIGATGARLLTTLAHILHAQKKELGLVSMCIGGGESVSMSIRRL